MYYDLHIHSCLSPCSDDTMTIYNIFHMAYIKGLQLIAITDHNSLKQQYLLHDVIQSHVLKDKIDFIYGVELQTKEKIHILAYFQKNTDLIPIQNWIDQHLYKVKNDVNFYGHQYICDIHDEWVNEEPYLLLESLDLNIYEVIKAIHQFHGIIILAHVKALKYGICEIYHGIPDDLDYDGIEVESIKQWHDLIEEYPTLRTKCVFINSDAHQLEDINEPMYQIDKKTWDELWRNICKKSQ